MLSLHALITAQPTGQPGQPRDFGFRILGTLDLELFGFLIMEWLRLWTWEVWDFRSGILEFVICGFWILG